MSKFADEILALCRACVVGNVAKVDTILSKNQRIVNATDGEGFSPLLLATSYNMVSVVELLLARKAAINQFDLAGKCSPLLLASQCGHAKIANILLAAKASPNSILDYVSPLILASKRGHIDIVEALVEARADVDFIATDGMTALFAASREGHTDIVDSLLRNGAERTMEQDRETYTPMLIASFYGHAPVVQLLYDSGAQVDGCDSAGCTCLHLAASGGHLEVLRVLCGYQEQIVPSTGEKVDEQDEMLEFEYNLNCDINRRQRDGATPFFLAAQENFVDCMALLARCDADVRSGRASSAFHCHLFCLCCRLCTLCIEGQHRKG